MDLGALFGGLPTSDTQPASLEQQWSQALKKPEFQAGLLNFGIELMKPRWSGASALPDALSAGARGYAGVQEEDYNRQREQQKLQMSQSEKQADRDNRIEIAQIGADSRAEVQGLRNIAMSERERTKAELRGSGFTPQENARYNTLVRGFLDMRKNDLTKMGQPVDEAAITKEAAAMARSIVLGERVGESGTGGAGEITSQNPQSGGGPVGPSGARQTGNITSQNPQNQGALPSAAEQIEKLKKLGKWPSGRLSPAEAAWLKARVRDPEYIDNMLLATRPR